MLMTLVTVVHVFICVVLIGIVLLQQGRGADMGATFGGGGTTLFGASGADTLLTKVTTGTAAAFMVTSVLLAIDAKQQRAPEGNLFKGAASTAATDKLLPEGASPLQKLGGDTLPAAKPAEASAAGVAVPAQPAEAAPPVEAPAAQAPAAAVTEPGAAQGAPSAAPQ